MGWTDAYNYLRNGAARLAGNEAPRTDGDLPLGARIGSVVGIQQSPLLRAVANGSLITLPDADDTRIVAVSQLRLKQSGGLYRYYLETGDRDDKEKFLQVYQNASGEVSEIMYCTQLARVIPETADDQDAYTGQAGAGLGDRSYTLWRAAAGRSGPGPGPGVRQQRRPRLLARRRRPGDAVSCRRSPAPRSGWTTPAAAPACARKCISCRMCAHCAAAAASIC